VDSNTSYYVTNKEILIWEGPWRLPESFLYSPPKK